MIKQGNEIKVGDTLSNAVDKRAIGQVKAIRPYTGPLVELLGQGTQIASFYSGGNMTLPAVDTFEVAA
jgi:hypothetical protein